MNDFFVLKQDNFDEQSRYDETYYLQDDVNNFK